MSDEAKGFIMRCFVPKPDDRATAAELLNDAFLRLSSRKKTKPPKDSDLTDSADYHRSLSVPISILVEDTDLDTSSIDLASSLDLRKHWYATRVKKVLKQQRVKPHWMFALDNLLRQAVQDAITVLLPELKLHLQSSFELEDSIPEEQPVDPDTPVVLVPDQRGAPTDTQQAGTGNKNGTTAGLNTPTKVFLNRDCPLSEKLRDMRVETMRYL
ncbi:hypothetical protein GOODEAATRI_004935 [Goodea atripinnis]|uniref:MAP3K HisK-N-like globin domain-containing protein n=1 Tax=Goodea atripinnis TaxID=208336 RepID=A0ABV0N7Z3_9TELE